MHLFIVFFFFIEHSIVQILELFKWFWKNEKILNCKAQLIFKQWIIYFDQRLVQRWRFSIKRHVGHNLLNTVHMCSKKQNFYCRETTTKFRASTTARTHQCSRDRDVSTRIFLLSIVDNFCRIFWGTITRYISVE